MKFLRSISINCKEASRMHTRQAEIPLTFIERMKLKIHLWICKPCHYFSKQAVLIQDTLKKLPGNSHISFSPRQKEDLQKKINAGL